MNKYEKIKELIEKNRDVVNFSDFGCGLDEGAIVRAEKNIGLSFPPSYRWWLKNYSGGEIGGEEVFSVYEIDDGVIVSGDLVGMYKSYHRDQGVFLPEMVPICHSDIDGLFYFDFSKLDENGECRVFSAVTNQVYSNDFLDFLEKRIMFHTEGRS